MIDNTLIALLISVLNSGLTSRGMSVAVKQSNQPTQQGPNTTPTAYIFKLQDHNHGHVGRYDRWNADTETMEHIEIRVIESTFQVTALAQQDPTSTTGLTASDIAQACASILSHDSALDLFNAQGVGVLRVTDIRNPYFVDDQDQFKASPSFDLVLTHEQAYTITANKVSAYEAQIKHI